ncbi:MAG: hypothetical protein H0X34_01920 [Chthoniobacterales bacterium]|nr:hypothetical protein [Chthoniobacterales bacterium]
MRRLRILLATLCLTLFTPGFVSSEAASSGQLYTFYGQVKTVDLAAKTLMIQSGDKSFVFHYTDETKISSYNGYIRWDKVRPGQGATVVMRLGEGNVGIAVKVRFEVDGGRAANLALFSARTIRGENVSGIAVSNYVDYEPPGDLFHRAIDLGSAAGLFLISVQPDGTAGKVTPLKSLGYAELDKRAATWIRKWKFHANSVSEVRIPVAISRVW